MKKQFKFSILEMMVVIAIILILMSMVMPVLQVVKDRANRAKTMSAAKSIGLIMIAYAEDDLKNFKMPYPLPKDNAGGLPVWGNKKEVWSTSVAEMLFVQKYMRKGDEGQLKSNGTYSPDYVSMKLNDSTAAKNNYWDSQTSLDFHLYCDKGLTSNVSGKVVLVATYDNDHIKNCQFDGQGWALFFADKSSEFVKRLQNNVFDPASSDANVTSVDIVESSSIKAKLPTGSTIRKEIPAASGGPGAWGLGGGSTELMGKKDTDPIYKLLVR